MYPHFFSFHFLGVFFAVENILLYVLFVFMEFLAFLLCKKKKKNLTISFIRFFGCFLERYVSHCIIFAFVGFLPKKKRKESDQMFFGLHLLVFLVFLN